MAVFIILIRNIIIIISNNKTNIAILHKLIFFFSYKISPLHNKVNITHIF